MDNNSHSLDNFEEKLKQHNSKKPARLYSSSKNEKKPDFRSKIQYNHKDIIRNISAQIKAMQNADCVIANKNINKALVKHKTACFVPVNELLTSVVPQSKAAKFETQFVLDTQLINVIEDVEAMSTHKGITQEFDNPFDHINMELYLKPPEPKIENCLKTINSQNPEKEVIFCKENDKQSKTSGISKDIYLKTHSNEQKYVKSSNEYELSNNKTSMDDNCTALLDKCIEIEDNVNIQDIVTDTDLNPSLVISINRSKKSVSTSPLVFNLDSFEKFEKLAHPIMEENNDIETVKHLINSQIIGRELFIHTDFEPELAITKERLSPVLKISKTPKIIRHDLAQPCTSNMKLNSFEKSLDKASENIVTIQNNKDKIYSNNKLNLIGNTLDNFTDTALTETINKQEIKSIDFEDEILFSSDEEQDIKQTNIMDLPFTCALETSFYEHSEVLDTTMYVGFQTASNKSIQISTDSFTKAKSILDDETGNGTKAKVPTLKELVEKCDNNPKAVTIISGNASANNVGLNKNKEIKKDSYVDLDVNTTNTKFVGFKTANEKAIEINNKNMNTGKSLFNNIDINDKPIALTNQSKDTKKFDGFKTASNKNINLSEKALKRCKRVFQDIDLEENFCDENLPSETEPCIKRIKHSLEINEVRNNNVIKTSDKECDTDIPKIDQDILQEFEGEMSFQDNVNDKDNEFIGFKTASNKNIRISDTALAKSKMIFEDIDGLDTPNKNMSINNVTSSNSKEVKIGSKHNNIGFKTASNKTINISDHALAKTKNIFQDIDFSDPETKTTTRSVIENLIGNKETALKDSIDKNRHHVRTDTGFVGFKTASNEMIKVSEEAVTKTKNIFRNIDSYEAENNDFSDTIANRTKTVDFSKPSISKESFVGFRTANNKKITVSAVAFEKTKNIFQDLQSENNFLEDIDVAKLIQDKMFSEEFNNDFQQNFNACNLCENIKGKDKLDIITKDSTVNDTDNKCKIFQTNTNKFEDMSKDGPGKSNIVIQDILSKKDMPESSFKGFQTASNKHIQISANALAKSKKLFEDRDEEKVKLVLHGFGTAGNKEVKISDKALAKSKNMFEDIDKSDGTVNKVDNNSNYPVFKGFQTASNKKVKISAQALAKSKKIFEDLDKDNKFGNISSSPVFKVFQTASNKEVNISAQALGKSKKIFEDLDEDSKNFDEVVNISPSPVFKGFHTASKKQLKISEAALEKNRNVFEDKDTVEKDSCITKVAKIKSDFQNVIKKAKVTSSFVGFQTASKKGVKISPAALARAKMMFEGIDLVKENALKAEKNSAKPAFLAFQTASNKEVNISSEPLAKSKKLFEEYCYDCIGDNNAVADVVRETERHEGVLTSFKGFQTASNKEVKISAEALAKSKQVFQDLSYCKENEFSIKENQQKMHEFKGFKTPSDKKVVVSEDALNKGRQILSEVNETNIDYQVPKTSFSFKSANNNDIMISEEALFSSRKLFTELDHSEDFQNSGIIKLKTNILHSKKPKHDINIKKLIDTQVIKNFDESLNTEDFRSPENRSKRSGSPILSCPKAKRRKFATPYKKDNLLDAKQPHNEEIEIHDDSYKKNKKYTLRDIAKLEYENTDDKVTTDIRINDIDLNDFEFIDKRNDISESTLSLELLKVIFLKGVNKKLVPDGWYENHVKLILWKLISYEVKFPKMMSGICTANNVLLQLKYRYFKELYCAERPALRKILEKDDVASKTLVLCVMDVINHGSDKSATNPPDLLLTDGWYTIRACIDKMLAKYVSDGKIRIGTKIVSHGAELVNCEQGVAPWEDTSSVRLKIFGNATRRARWHARLGYHGNGAILSQLSAVKPEGGKVGAIRVIVTRVYPPLFVEKFEDGSTVTRSERLEHIHQMKYEAEREAVVEKIYEEVQKEMSDEDSPESEDIYMSKRSLDSGSQIARLLKMSKEPSQLRANLTESQRRLLETYTNSKRDKILQDIEGRVRSKLAVMTRNVVPLLKVRVADLHREKADKALLTIWKPNDALSELITEGAVVEILNVVPTAIRYSELQLSAGRQTVFKQTNKKTQEKLQPYLKSLTRTCYPIKDIVFHPSKVTDYNEIDTVGMIIQIDPSHSDFTTANQFQNVYMTDEERNIICVNFWGGIKKFGFENILDTGQVVACVNLQKRAGNTRKNIPQYRATEFTYFTKTPKNIDARNLIEELSKKVSRKKGFIEECVDAKNNLLKCNISNENVSPYRFHNHDFSRNKIYVESPLARIPKVHDEFNLSGLDFESTFRQTEPQELSPKSLLRKKRIQEKISKLKMYGEPPPLSPINIINKSKNATKSFKSPLLNTSVTSKEDTPVASAKKLPENLGEDELNCSPVLVMNRSLKKVVHPVKLDFNSALDENESEDQFAEEFDPSPPLSLD